jgi:hypothetical protein
MIATLPIIELVHEATHERACFGCGGDVMSGRDPATGELVALCGRCGEVLPWATTDRHGNPVPGFLSCRDAARWTMPQHNGDGTITLGAGDPS